MLAFLLPLASKIISDAVAKIPENEELGEKLVDICLVILGKAVKLTKTDMDDQLLEVVTKSIKAREENLTPESMTFIDGMLLRDAIKYRVSLFINTLKELNLYRKKT